jgi:hypothetical protein
VSIFTFDVNFQVVYVLPKTSDFRVLGFYQVAEEVMSLSVFRIFMMWEVSFILFWKQLYFSQLAFQEVYSLLLLLAYRNVLCYCLLIETFISYSLHFLLLFILLYNLLHHSHLGTDISLRSNSVSELHYLFVHFVFDLLTISD